MSQFDESQHPRGPSGRFAEHVGSEQAGALDDDWADAVDQQSSSRPANPFTLIDQLPADFHEVHGRRPDRFHDHAETSAWLRKMEDATLVSADNLSRIAETTGDERAIEQAGQYLRAHQAIAALRAPSEDPHPDADAAYIGDERASAADEDPDFDLSRPWEAELGFDPTHFNAADIERARSRLERLGERDPESAHSKAEDLLRDSLAAIRDGRGDPARISDAALYIESAKFSRWFA